MRRALALALLAALLPAAPSSGGPGPGYFASDNVTYVGTFPLNTDSAGAKILDGYMYLTTARGLMIYSLEDPESPELLSFLPLPQQPQFSEEDPDGNGKILLVGGLDAAAPLYVIDVEDKSNPSILAEVDGANEHTITCVLGCTWAYGSGGVIVDLRDPAAPKIAGNWAEGTPSPGGGHDVTEVAPGLVVTSTNPVMLLDARKDPAKPSVIALGKHADQRFIHSNLWPRRGRDRFLLVGGETGGPFCGEQDAGAFMTWDTKGWRRTRTFTMVDEYRVTDGLPTDGNAVVHTFCTHWFDTRPGYRNGGVVAMAWYEHGTRLLEVSRKGQISEAGYFLPAGGSTSAAYWITDEILYSVDYQRGLDILRVAR